MKLRLVNLKFALLSPCSWHKTEFVILVPVNSWKSTFHIKTAFSILWNEIHSIRITWRLKSSLNPSTAFSLYNLHQHGFPYLSFVPVKTLKNKDPFQLEMLTAVASQDCQRRPCCWRPERSFYCNLQLKHFGGFLISHTVPLLDTHECYPHPGLEDLQNCPSLSAGICIIRRDYTM